MKQNKGEMRQTLDRLRPTKDRRVVYGMGCVWWGNIADTVVPKDGIPRCPHCHGVLFEMEGEDVYMDAVRRYEREKGLTGYTDFIRWLRGKCFIKIDVAAAAWALETKRPSPLVKA